MIAMTYVTIVKSKGYIMDGNEVMIAKYTILYNHNIKIEVRQRLFLSKNV